MAHDGVWQLCCRCSRNGFVLELSVHFFPDILRHPVPLSVHPGCDPTYPRETRQNQRGNEDDGRHTGCLLGVVVPLALLRGNYHCIALLDRWNGGCGCLQMVIFGTDLPLAVVVLFEFHVIRCTVFHLLRQSANRRIGFIHALFPVDVVSSVRRLEMGGGSKECNVSDRTDLFWICCKWTLVVPRKSVDWGPVGQCEYGIR